MGLRRVGAVVSKMMKDKEEPYCALLSPFLRTFDPRFLETKKEGNRSVAGQYLSFGHTTADHKYDAEQQDHAHAYLLQQNNLGAPHNPPLMK